MKKSVVVTISKPVRVGNVMLEAGDVIRIIPRQNEDTIEHPNPYSQNPEFDDNVSSDDAASAATAGNDPDFKAGTLKATQRDGKAEAKKGNKKAVKEDFGDDEFFDDGMDDGFGGPEPVDFDGDEDDGFYDDDGDFGDDGMDDGFGDEGDDFYMESKKRKSRKIAEDDDEDEDEDEDEDDEKDDDKKSDDDKMAAVRAAKKEVRKAVMKLRMLEADEDEGDAEEGKDEVKDAKDVKKGSEEAKDKMAAVRAAQKEKASRNAKKK
jgi:hypothetical protein